MDLLASRGARTLFPPVNSGVEDFLKERGYSKTICMIHFVKDIRAQVK